MQDSESARHAAVSASRSVTCVDGDGDGRDAPADGVGQHADGRVRAVVAQVAQDRHRTVGRLDRVRARLVP